MRRAAALSLAGAMLAFSLSLASAEQAQAPAGCPDEDEVHAAVERYIDEDFWSAGQKEIWQIERVDNFVFGVIKYGRPGGGGCPLRMEYSFRVIHRDGRVEQTKKGVGETFDFRRDNFDEWAFTVGPS